MTAILFYSRSNQPKPKRDWGDPKSLITFRYDGNQFITISITLKEYEINCGSMIKVASPDSKSKDQKIDVFSENANDAVSY